MEMVAHRLAREEGKEHIVMISVCLAYTRYGRAYKQQTIARGRQRRIRICGVARLVSGFNDRLSF